MHGETLVWHAHGGGLSPAFGVWTNLLIGLSYVVISVSLALLVVRLRAELPFRWLFGLFGLFIIACGSGHLAAAAGLSARAPMVDSVIALVTAVASVGTAVLLPFLLPAIAATVRDARAAGSQRVEIAVLERANRTKAQFMAAMSHELRTPLNAIIGYTQLLDADLAGPLGAEQREHVRRIGIAGQHLNSLVEQVLDFERLNSGQYEMMLTAESIARLGEESLQIVRPLAEVRKLELRGSLPPAELRLELDARAMRQIMLNLLSNAIKYTRRGHARLSVEWSDDLLRIVVSDTGIGIAPADLRRVWEPFWQADQKLTRAVGGAGLGLAITKALVERLGGSIELSSELGTGTTVTVWIPASPAAPAMQDAIAGAGNRELSQPTAFTT